MPATVICGIDYGLKERAIGSLEFLHSTRSVHLVGALVGEKSTDVDDLFGTFSVNFVQYNIYMER